jgi:hypothetical protein
MRRKSHFISGPVGRRALAGAGAVAWLMLATAVDACSHGSSFNPYAEWLARPKPGDVAAAATIDWVRVESPGPPPCPRPLPWDTPKGTPEPPRSAACMAASSLISGPDYPFVATVIESLKGASPQRFVLVHPSWRPEGAGGWAYFSDLRSAPQERQFALSIQAKARADTRHLGAWFWDRASLEPINDGSNSCGGDATLDYSLPYIVYRDTAGRVLGMEPVLYQDDELLQRLRKAKTQRGSAAPTANVADVFRTADALLLVEARRCHWVGSHHWYDRRVETRVLRGDPDSLPRMDYVDLPSGDNDYRRVPGVAADFIYDWALAHHQACGGGQAMLVVKAPFSGFPKVAPDTARAEALAPVSAAALKEIVARDPLWVQEQDRTAPVLNGLVRRPDLDTGLVLAGPQTFTVDQAFAWFAEGAASRAERAAHAAATPGS